MPHTFEEYRRIFDGAISKYENQSFFSTLIREHGKPAFPSARLQVVIVGIRHEGKETNFRDNTADDTISLVRLDGEGLPQVSEYVGTTDPGLFDRVINEQGDFKLNPGFYFFKLGMHHSEHACLVQACTVLGERAKKGERFDETDQKIWQITDGSLHIHAGIGHVENVGEWSAGCQVIAGGWQGKAWSEFFERVKQAPKMPVPYVLVKDTDVPQLLS